LSVFWYFLQRGREKERELLCLRRRDSFLVNPGDIDPWWLSILAILPALLATILVFLDQQITAVIVNRKEHKLKVNLHL